MSHPVLRAWYAPTPRSTRTTHSLCQGKVRWAMAGRDRAKLEKIKQSLVEVNPAVEVRMSGCSRAVD